MYCNVIVIVFNISVLGGIVWLGAGILHYNNQSGTHKITTFLQVVSLAMAIINVIIVSKSIDNKEGLTLINQIFSWTISGN